MCIYIYINYATKKACWPICSNAAPVVSRLFCVCGTGEENLRMYLRKHNLEIGGDATTYVSEQPMPAEPSRAEQAPWSAPPSGVISAELRDLESAPETHEATPLPGTSMSRPESSRPFSSVGRSETPRRGSGMGPKEASVQRSTDPLAAPERRGSRPEDHQWSR